MDRLNHNDMETRQTCIVDSIKAIRSSKKLVDEFTVYKFVKRELHSIINTVINYTLKKLIEMGRIENKPSKDKISYFLTDFEPHIPTIMTTPVVESSFNDILSASFEDQINSFVSSDTADDNDNSLETLKVIDNAYKYAKYKKMKMSYYPR